MVEDKYFTVVGDNYFPCFTTHFMTRYSDLGSFIVNNFGMVNIIADTRINTFTTMREIMPRLGIEAHIINIAMHRVTWPSAASGAASDSASRIKLMWTHRVADKHVTRSLSSCSYRKPEFNI